MNRPVKCFIVEGESRDLRFIKRMTGIFFKGKYEAVVINLPAAQNIYMLYQKMQKDSFETDVIELLREDVEEARKALDGVDRQSIDEVYLFFDYDLHENNLSNNQDPLSVLGRMIRFFDNETENGKLYISYPMVEALYDFKDGQCEPYTMCWLPQEKFGVYKTMAGNGNRHASTHLDNYGEWCMMLSIFGLRVKCLFDTEKIDYVYYTENVTVESIYNRQNELFKKKNAILVLSAFPEFLFDYFQYKFWRKYFNRRKMAGDHCPKGNVPSKT